MTKKKSKAIARKMNSISKKQMQIDRAAAELKNKLGPEKYEQLRTGKVKLDMSDSKKVSLINKRYNDIQRKKKAIIRKFTKMGMLNYQGDK